MAEKVIGVLASGRGSNLQAIVDNIMQGYLPVKIGVVICDKSDAYALQRAAQVDIPACVIERSSFSCKEDFEQAISEKLLEHNVQLVVLAGFMRLLGSKFIKNWHMKIMNIHPSLLPSFPGLHPQRQALTYGARVSGCTVHFVDEGMDSGPIILQKAVSVLDNDDEDALAARILKEEHLLYSQAISLWAQSKIFISGRQVQLK